MWSIHRPTTHRPTELSFSWSFFFRFRPGCERHCATALRLLHRCQSFPIKKGEKVRPAHPPLVAIKHHARRPSSSLLFSTAHHQRSNRRYCVMNFFSSFRLVPPLLLLLLHLLFSCCSDAEARHRRRCMKNRPRQYNILCDRRGGKGRELLSCAVTQQLWAGLV